MTGANHDLKDSNRRSAADIAKFKDHMDCYDILRTSHTEADGIDATLFDGVYGDEFHGSDSDDASMIYDSDDDNDFK